MSDPVIAELVQALERRRRDGLLRARRRIDGPQGPRITVDGQPLLAFASNDYLGLAAAPELVDAVCGAARRYGVGAGASHLVVGHGAAHEMLERELAAFVAPCEGARALLFSSGYLANLAILTALASRNDVIYADRLNHACLNDGALLARADFERYAHADIAALAKRIGDRAGSRSNAEGPDGRTRRRFIVTDAVFSMDGDIAPLPALLDLAQKHDAWLVVDDAHGFGVLGGGRGSLAHFGLRSERIVYMGTLGKAAGVAGAFVAAHPAVIETLVQTARPYIYTTAAPPLTAAALRASLALIAEQHWRRSYLEALIGAFRSAARDLPWKLLPSQTPIQPLVIGGAVAALAVSDALLERGVLVPAIRPPTVPANTARLRVSLSAAHRMDDVALLCQALHEVAATVVA